MPAAKRMLIVATAASFRLVRKALLSDVSAGLAEPRRLALAPDRVSVVGIEDRVGVFRRERPDARRRLVPDLVEESPDSCSFAKKGSSKGRSGSKVFECEAQAIAAAASKTARARRFPASAPASSDQVYQRAAADETSRLVARRARTCRRHVRRNRPVADRSQRAISSGVPVAMISPPASPPSGPGR